jgi:two-component system response regulator HydG
VPIVLPPLRDRKSDVASLVTHFLEKLRMRTRSDVRGVSAAALERLSGHHWPGNVRELENVVERALVMAEGDLLEASDLPTLSPNGEGGVERRGEQGAPFPAGGLDLTRVVEGLEEKLLREALERARGVKAEAARLLGLKPSALYYKLEKYGIEA